MSARQPHSSPCTLADAATRLRQAEALVLVADLAQGDDTDTATPGVAAALAVLAGVAASDAACCAKLGVRPRGRAHNEAIRMLEAVVPHGQQMARDLTALPLPKTRATTGFT